MKLPLSHIALASSLIGCGAKEPGPNEYNNAKHSEKSTVLASGTSQVTASNATRSPEVGIKARTDKLLALGTALIKVNEAQIEWGTKTLEEPGLFGVSVYAGQLIWLEKHGDEVTLHRRIGETIHSKSLLWFGQESTVTSHGDGETIWLVDNSYGSSKAMQFSMSGEREVQHQLVELGRSGVTDAATDPSGGLWVATQSKVKRIRNNETVSLKWSNTSSVSRLLVTENRLWILTIDGTLSEVDLTTLSIVNEVKLPGAGIAIVDTSDGFYVATGVPNNRHLVHVHRLSKDGTVRWTSTPQSMGERTLVAFDDRVVYGSVGNYVTLDVDNGTTVEGTE